MTVVKLTKVEQPWSWSEQTNITMFFWIPKNVTSRRPIAVLPHACSIGAGVEVRMEDYVERKIRSQSWSGKDGVGDVVGDGEV